MSLIYTLFREWTGGNYAVDVKRINLHGGRIWPGRTVDEKLGRRSCLMAR